MKNYNSAIENYKSALFYVAKDNYQRKTSLYEELLLQYFMIDNVEVAKIIYSKVPENIKKRFVAAPVTKEEKKKNKCNKDFKSIDILFITSFQLPIFFCLNNFVIKI